MDRARVLVVDDDERNLLAIETVIEDVAEVVVARSGEEALRHLLKGEFAVILLDVYMPGLDGYETAQIIRSREQTKRIPIVFLSAVNKETEHLIRGYSMGAVDYVFKPVEPVVLRSKVAVFVDIFLMTKEIQRKALQEQRLLDANLQAHAELLRTEQELRRVEQREAAIIASLPIVLYLEGLDSSPRVPSFVSGNFQSLTGFALDDLVERPNLWTERLHPEDRDRMLDALVQRRKRQAMSVEYRWQSADGQYRHFLDEAVLLLDGNGAPLEYAGTLLDITDRRELENQLVHAQKMDAIGKLTGGIAHDFNNLLAAVLGGLGLIERRVTLSDDQQKILRMTRHAAEQGADLVRRLLAFARRQKLEPADISYARLSETVRDLLAHTLGGMIELEWVPNPDAWSIYADENQLELALMNLIINARDAMPDGGVVTVTSANRSCADIGEAKLAPGEYVVITVRDTGHGIPPEIVERVMEPFFTTKEVGKGTGLGLSMVYGFLQQSGGALRIESEVGYGTCMELWLPRAPEAADDRPVPIRTLPERSVTSVALRVMLVDDHDAVRHTTAALLRDMGHDVVEAPSGADMLKMFAPAPDAFDLLITDYAMPRMSGVELIEQVRALRGDLPSIIITGYADAQAIAQRAEDVAVLPKPFAVPGLIEAIESVSQSAGKAVAA